MTQIAISLRAPQHFVRRCLIAAAKSAENSVLKLHEPFKTKGLDLKALGTRSTDIPHIGLLTFRRYPSICSSTSSPQSIACQSLLHHNRRAL
jgi:hypothetical protein